MADRFDFFFRQKVTEAELDAGFDELENADFQQMIDLGLVGALQNAVVTEKSGTPDLTVDISGSAAVHDKLGQRIGWGAAQNLDVSVDNLSTSTAVGTPGNEKIVSVFAKFVRSATDARIDGNSLTVYFNQAESFGFHVTQGAETASPPATPPSLHAEYILLADIRRDNPQTQIFNSDITGPTGTYTGITDRREAAFALTAGALTVSTGTPEESDQAILTHLNNHVTGVASLHPATAIDYAGGAAWLGGRTNPATTVELQLDKIITDLAAVGTGDDGVERIGSATYVGVSTTLPAASSARSHLNWLADKMGGLAANNTWTGAQIFGAALTFNHASWDINANIVVDMTAGDHTWHWNGTADSEWSFGPAATSAGATIWADGFGEIQNRHQDGMFTFTDDSTSLKIIGSRAGASIGAGWNLLIRGNKPAASTNAPQIIIQPGRPGSSSGYLNGQTVYDYAGVDGGTKERVETWPLGSHNIAGGGAKEELLGSILNESDVPLYATVVYEVELFFTAGTGVGTAEYGHVILRQIVTKGSTTGTFCAVIPGLDTVKALSTSLGASPPAVTIDVVTGTSGKVSVGVTGASTDACAVWGIVTTRWFQSPTTSDG